MSHSALFRKSRAVYGEGIAQGRTSEWSDVMPGGERPFDFTTTKKNRHRVRPLQYVNVTTEGGWGWGVGEIRQFAVKY